VGEVGVNDFYDEDQSAGGTLTPSVTATAFEKSRRSPTKPPMLMFGAGPALPTTTPTIAAAPSFTSSQSPTRPRPATGLSILGYSGEGRREKLQRSYYRSSDDSRDGDVNGYVDDGEGDEEVKDGDASSARGRGVRGRCGREIEAELTNSSFYADLVKLNGPYQTMMKSSVGGGGAGAGSAPFPTHSPKTVVHVPTMISTSPSALGAASPSLFPSQSRSPSPRKGRLTLGLPVDASNPPFDLVDYIIGDLEIEYDVSTITPQKLQRYTDQLQKAAPVPEGENSPMRLKLPTHQQSQPRFLAEALL